MIITLRCVALSVKLQHRQYAIINGNNTYSKVYALFIHKRKLTLKRLQFH